MIRTMGRRDLPGVVAVHRESFQGFFLSQLGPKFLACLYEEIMRDPAGMALVDVEGGEILGFAAGTLEPRSFYTRLLRRRWYKFAITSIIPVCRNPRIVPRLLNAFGKSREEIHEQGCGLLMSIGVSLRSQGGGRGSALLQAFLDEGRRRGLRAVHLTTDRDDNDRTNRFYAKMGFSIAGTFATPQGRWMNDYRIEIPGER